MANETEQLVVSLEARINQFEKNFARAQRTANDNFAGIERRAKRSADELEKSFDKAGSSIAAKLEQGLAPLMRGGILAAGVTAAATALGQMAKSVAEVDREARKAGVSADVWQRWAFVAKASGMEIDGVTDALKELNIRGDEFAKTGKGSAQEAFTRLGYTATDVAKRLKDPSAFIDEIIGKLQKMDAAAQTRILDETFGGTGAEQMAKVLGLSVAQIQKLRGEAAVFSTEQIDSAKKIDAEFEKLWRNVSVYAKQAAINSVGYASSIIDTISTLKGDKLIERDKQNALSPEGQMRRLLEQRAKIAAQISDVQSNPFNVLKDTELRQLEASLKAVDDQISELGGGSDELKAALSELSSITQGAANTFNNSATSAANFKTALAEIKNLVPGLKADLDNLATFNGIDAAYQRAVQNARTMGEVQQATSLANSAKASVRVSAATSNSSEYLSGFLASGKGRASVDNMADAFSKKLATMLASLPDNLQGQVTINSGFRDAARQQELWLQALQKYGSAEEARKWVAPPGNSQHNRGNAADLGYGSDMARQWVHQNAGNFGLSFPLNNENWHIEDSDARRSADSAAMQEKINLAKQQNDARKDLNQTVQEALNLAQFENSISGMTAQQQQVELGVFRAKQEAQRAGITLSNDELNAIRAKIQETERLNGVNQQTAKSAEGLGQAQQFFADGFTSALSGLVTGTSTLNSAMQQLANSIINASLQALLLGQGPLAGLFGGGTSSGTGTKAVGGLLGALFSKDGGPVSHSRRKVLHLAGGGNVRGPGTSKSDSIPAWLSDGEFVVNAEATARNRAALEAINAGKAPKLADGGAIGRAGSGAGSAGQGSVNNVFAPTIPITVQASGNQETDKLMRDRLHSEMNTLLDNKMTEFVADQQRPGSMLSRKGFS